LVTVQQEDASAVGAIFLAATALNLPGIGTQQPGEQPVSIHPDKPPRVVINLIFPYLNAYIST